MLITTQRLLRKEKDSFHMRDYLLATDELHSRRSKED